MSSFTPFSSSISSTRSRGIPRFPDSDNDQATSAEEREQRVEDASGRAKGGEGSELAQAFSVTQPLQCSRSHLETLGSESDKDEGSPAYSQDSWHFGGLSLSIKLTLETRDGWWGWLDGWVVRRGNGRAGLLQWSGLKQLGETSGRNRGWQAESSSLCSLWCA